MSAIIQGKGDVFGPIGAVAGNIPVFDGASGKIIKDGLSPSVLTAMPRGYLSGMQLNVAADAVNDHGIGVGACRDSTNQYDIILPATITKQLDAPWAAGNNQGGRDTGATANGSWHIFAILDPASGAVDVLYSLSVSAPTMPSGFTAFRRIGSVTRIAGANTGFRQLGDYFQLLAPVFDLTDAQPTPGQVFGCTFSQVPQGMKLLVRANFRGHSSGGAATFSIREPDVSFGGLGELWCPIANASSGITLEVWTGTASQIVNTYVTGPATAHFFAQALGYWDNRGR